MLLTSKEALKNPNYPKVCGFSTPCVNNCSVPLYSAIGALRMCKLCLTRVWQFLILPLTPWGLICELPYAFDNYQIIWRDLMERGIEWIENTCIVLKVDCFDVLVLYNWCYGDIWVTYVVWWIVLLFSFVGSGICLWILFVFLKTFDWPWMTVMSH